MGFASPTYHSKSVGFAISLYAYIIYRFGVYCNKKTQILLIRQISVALFVFFVQKDDLRLDDALFCGINISLYHRKPVAAFVFRVTRMTPYPLQRYIMYVQQGKAFFPEIGVERRLFVGFYPAVFLP